MELELGQARDLIPPDVAVRTIGYGSPPVFTSNNCIPDLPNICTSLRNVNDVFLKTSAIDKLNYKRRDLLKMLLSDVNPDEAEESEVNNNSTLSDSDQTTTDDEIQWIDSFKKCQMKSVLIFQL